MLVNKYCGWMFRFQVPSKLSLISMVCRMVCACRLYCTSDFIPIYSYVTMHITGMLSVMDFMDGTGSMTCFRANDLSLLLLLLLLLEARKLQRTFGLLNEFLPFRPISDAALPVCYFHHCYIPFYIIFPSIFWSS